MANAKFTIYGSGAVTVEYDDVASGLRQSRTEYTIVATDRSVDARAAADACNRELMAAGETFDRRAAENKIAECAECLRDALRVEAEEIENDPR